jgi:type IV secretion system protein VirB6
MSKFAFSTLGQSVDNALTSYFANSAAALATAITPLVVAGLTIWVVFYGWNTMNGTVQQPLKQFVRKYVGFALVCAVALSAATYQSIVVESASGLLDGLLSVLGPKSSSAAAATGIYDALDNLAIQILTLVSRAAAPDGVAWPIMLLPFSNILMMLVLTVCGAILLAIFAGFVILAKVAISVCFALGPLFVACLLFPPTARFFDAWLSKVLNYTLLMVILAALAGMTTHIASDVLTAMNGVPELADVFGFGCLMVALVVVAFNAPSMAAGLVGGSAMSGVGNIVSGFIMGAMRGSGGAASAKSAGGQISRGRA